jgi:hypothetical protein
MERRALTRSLAAAVMCAGAVAGCTGDDGMDVVVDGDADPSAELASAVERTEAGSGRMVQTMTWDMAALGGAFAEMDGEDGAVASDPADLGPQRWTMQFEGEFSGADLRATMRSTMDIGTDDPVDQTVDLVVVDGTSYASADGLMAAGAIAPELDPDTAVTAALAGRHWIEQPATDVGSGIFLDGTGAGLSGPGSTMELLGTLSQVEQGAPVEVDGVELQSFRGQADPDAFWSATGPEDADALLDGEELSPEDSARQERINRYREEHISVDVEVLVDPDGLLRRAGFTYRDNVEDRYRDCIDLMGMGEGSVVVEFRDLGAPVDIVAPDPADTMSAAEYEQVFEEWTTSTFERVDAATGGELDGLDAATMREDLEQEVRDGAASIGLDPSAVAGMTEDELYDAIERIVVAEEAAPKVPTALGDMSRSELLWHVRAGMEREGVDPSAAGGMTDQQLAALIDAYMADPDLAAKIPEEYSVDDPFGDGSTVMDDAGDGWMFEGCPE